MKESETGTSGTLTQVPVIVQVVGGRIECNPYKVVIFKDEEVEWVYHPGGLIIDFETTRPFGTQQFRAEKDQPTIRSGPADVDTREEFKYTVTVPEHGVEPLDPVVEADPRKRPTTTTPTTKPIK